MCVSALRDEPEMPTDDDSSDVAAASVRREVCERFLSFEEGVFAHVGEKEEQIVRKLTMWLRGTGTRLTLHTHDNTIHTSTRGYKYREA